MFLNSLQMKGTFSCFPSSSNRRQVVWIRRARCFSFIKTPATTWEQMRMITEQPLSVCSSSRAASLNCLSMMITDKRLHFLTITTATSMWISRARKASVFTLISPLTQPWISACSGNTWRRAKCLLVQNWLIRSLDSLQTRSFNYFKLKTSLKKGSLVRCSSNSLFTLT